jgi:hypothetical protein
VLQPSVAPLYAPDGVASTPVPAAVTVACLSDGGGGAAGVSEGVITGASAGVGVASGLTTAGSWLGAAALSAASRGACGSVACGPLSSTGGAGAPFSPSPGASALGGSAGAPESTAGLSPGVAARAPAVSSGVGAGVGAGAEGTPPSAGASALGGSPGAGAGATSEAGLSTGGAGVMTAPVASPGAGAGAGAGDDVASGVTGLEELYPSGSCWKKMAPSPGWMVLTDLLVGEGDLGVRGAMRRMACRASLYFLLSMMLYECSVLSRIACKGHAGREGHGVTELQGVEIRRIESEGLRAHDWPARTSHTQSRRSHPRSRSVPDLSITHLIIYLTIPSLVPLPYLPDALLLSLEVGVPVARAVFGPHLVHRLPVVTHAVTLLHVLRRKNTPGVMMVMMLTPCRDRGPIKEFEHERYPPPCRNQSTRGVMPCRNDVPFGDGYSCCHTLVSIACDHDIVRAVL